jgi:hypothetical protein
MQTPFFTPLRPGQPGDICLLLEPTDQGEIHALRQQQITLQNLYGGRLMEPVHLTCQRFVLNDQQRYPDLINMLVEFTAQYQPFSFQVQGLIPLYSPYRQMNILKWEIIPESRLKRFSARLEQLLQNPWTTSLYTPGWVSTLVTALVEIDGSRSISAERLPSFPHPLFTPSLLTVSKINGPSEFEILDKIPLCKA